MPSPLESLLIPSSRVFVDTRVRCFIQQCLAYCCHPHHALCSLISLFAQQPAVNYSTQDQFGGSRQAPVMMLHIPIIELGPPRVD
jgi:hypothetical protein